MTDRLKLLIAERKAARDDAIRTGDASLLLRTIWLQNKMHPSCYYSGALEDEIKLLIKVLCTLSPHASN